MLERVFLPLRVGREGLGEGVEVGLRDLAVHVDAVGYPAAALAAEDAVRLREVVGEEVRACEWTDKLRLLKHTAILKVNEWECQTLTNMTDPYEAAQQINDWGVREVIITLGGGGSVIYAEGKFYETPAYPPTKLVDATGCGDTYSAGYLYARAKGMSYFESGQFAAAMCTLKLEHTGPFTHSIDDVHQIIKNNQ